MNTWGFPTIAELSRYLGHARSENLSRIHRNPDAKPSVDIIEEFANKFDDLNLDWLITGKGDPRLARPRSVKGPITADPQEVYVPAPQAIEPVVITLDNDRKPNIVMLDSRAAAGFPANYGNPEFFKDKPSFSLPGYKFAAQGMIALQVTGDSMAPTIHHDDWLIARRLLEPAQELREGYVHLLVTADGCSAKRIFRSPVREALVCKSDNEEYPPFEHVMGAHDQLYVVLGLISEDLSRRSGGVRDRLRELEKDMEVMKHKLAAL